MFVLVAQAGTFSAAAKNMKLYVHRKPFDRKVRRLLGTMLCLCRPKGLTLTHTGSEFAGLCNLKLSLLRVGVAFDHQHCRCGKSRLSPASVFAADARHPCGKNESVLDQLIQDATVHYQVGQGMQQDVLQAQVSRTKIVKEITMHHQLMGQVQAHLKGLFSRDQASSDIVTEELIETPLKRTPDELLAVVRENNPQIQVDASSIRKQDAQLTSAKREGKPDFEVGFMMKEHALLKGNLQPRNRDLTVLD
jgi:hypothetical protein